MSWKRITVYISAVILLLAALSAAGCGDDDSDVPGDAQLGVIEQEHSLSVTSVTNPLNPGDDLAVPSPGMQYARIDIVVANQSDRKMVYSPANLKLETGDGDVFDYLVDFDGEDALAATVTLEPGAEATGGVVFEIPVGAAARTLIETTRSGENRIELPEGSPGNGTV